MFAVVVAIDLLDTGDAGVGVLNAAIGAGGVLGSFFAFGLVRRGGLASWFGVGIALFGAPLALIGVVPEQAAAIFLLGLVGIGNALIDVGGFTLLARLADETVLARMFAGFEAILTLGVAAGGLVAPLVIELLGVRPALVAIGLIAPLAVAASWPALRGLDAGMRVRNADIDDPAERPHAGCAAGGDHRAARCRAPARPRSRLWRWCSSRATLGDRFYVVESGTRRGRLSTVASSGRSAAVTASARSPSCVTSRGRRPFAPPRTRELHVSFLERPAFLTAVTGYPASAAAGHEVVTARLALDAEPAAGERTERSPGPASSERS